MSAVRETCMPRLTATSKPPQRSSWMKTSSVKASDLTNANVLLVGQKLTLPKVEIKQPTVTATAAMPSITGGSYEVKEGDSLWEIAVRAYGDGYQWVEIARANDLDNPDIIHPSNNLTIPR